MGGFSKPFFTQIRKAKKRRKDERGFQILAFFASWRLCGKKQAFDSLLFLICYSYSQNSRLQALLYRFLIHAGMVAEFFDGNKFPGVFTMYHPDLLEKVTGGAWFAACDFDHVGRIYHQSLIFFWKSHMVKVLQ
jgi:hypothetical protein